MFVALVILAWSAAISLYLWFRGPANLRKGSMPGDIRHGLTVKALQSMGEPDMIVIGSGPGGLTVAALMAKLGKKVLVLEQHDVAGVCVCGCGRCQDLVGGLGARVRVWMRVCLYVYVSLGVRVCTRTYYVCHQLLHGCVVWPSSGRRSWSWSSTTSPVCVCV